MGLTKQYLAYCQTGNFNIIASERPNISFVIYDKTEGRFVIAGGAENAIIWDLRLGIKVMELNREKQEVTAIRPSPDRTHIALGYADGFVEVFDVITKSVVFSLALHRTAVMILRYDTLGMRLISGGLDTEIVVSDIVTQTGKCRLIGHSGPVTDVHFLEIYGFDDIVVSSSKDTQIKFWNLETQTCFKTLVDNRTEIWGLALSREFLVAGSGENAMNVYRISKQEKNDSNTTPEGLLEGLLLDDEDIISPIKIKNCGAIQRSGKGRVRNLVADKNGRVISCHGTNDIIENFYFCSEDEAASRAKKRMKKQNSNSNIENHINEVSLTDEIKRLPTIKTKNTIKSMDILIGLNDELRIVINCSNNTLKMYSLDIKTKSAEPKILRNISQCGHQSEVRSVSFSSDSLAIASGSGESLKIWNRETLQCIRTVGTDYILTVCFVPGDRHVLLGMKSGRLLIVDIANGEILDHIEAHQNELWSVCLLPDLKGCVTGGGDTTVKLWHFELIESADPEVSHDGMIKPKVLSLLHQKTLKLDETVLCVKISQNSKFIAVSLLDSTVKIFFLDTFKFFLHLYGHKLPVLCMDISYDSQLIATGSADRNVKIWGMDFGNCHKSLFAHDNSVMALQFIPKTHLFFTCGKDGKIKQWDADNFQKIITLNGHIGEAYGLSVSPDGRYLVTCGSDRTLRLYERTDEPIVLQDVQEEEREEIENRTLATGDDSGIPTLPGLKLPSRKTVGSEKAAESILECIEICNIFDEDENPEIHPLMTAYDVKTSNDFLIAVLQRVRASDLEEALVILPFTYVCQILERIPNLSQDRKDQTELICKVVFFLFKLHQKPIVSNHTLLPIIGEIIKKLGNMLTELRDMVGVNLHALQILQRDIETRDGVELFREASRAKKQRDTKVRKRQLAKRLHIQMSWF